MQLRLLQQENGMNRIGGHGQTARAERREVVVGVKLTPILGKRFYQVTPKGFSAPKEAAASFPECALIFVACVQPCKLLLVNEVHTFFLRKKLPLDQRRSLPLQQYSCTNMVGE